jgi:hypothetical protein
MAAAAYPSPPTTHDVESAGIMSTKCSSLRALSPPMRLGSVRTRAGRGQGQGGVSCAAGRPRSIGQWEAGSRRVEKLEYCASCVIDLVAGVGVRN